MSKSNYCAVAGCTATNVSLHTLPLDPDLRQQWLSFMFPDGVPENASQHLRVCTAHFTPDCVDNQRKFNSGFAKRLLLKPGSVPTLLISTSDTQVLRKSAGSQTDPPERHTIGTQLSLKTLQPRVRSKAVQTTGSCDDFGVDTHTDPYTASLTFLTSQPLKRRRLDLEQDSSPMVARKNKTLKRCASSSQNEDPASEPSHDQPPLMKKNIPLNVCVNIACLLPLFRQCGQCSGVCVLRNQWDNSLFTVFQHCQICNQLTTWTNQPFQEDGESVEVELTVDEEDCGGREEKEEEEEAESPEESESEEEEEEWEMDDEEEETEEDEMSVVTKIRTVRKKLSDGPDPLGHSRRKSRLKKAQEMPETLCTDCGNMYNTLTHSCDPKKSFQCPTCGVSFLNELSVNVHVNGHCRSRYQPCVFCFKPFNTLPAKLTHEMSHSGENPYECPKCPQRFSDKSTRSRHLKEHPERFRCKTCQKEFTKLHKLQRHEMSHSANKPFKCEVCDRVFSQASQLKSHMRVHTGEKPFQCQFCPMCFNHNISLKNHLKRFHPGELPKPDLMEQGEGYHSPQPEADDGAEESFEGKDMKDGRSQKQDDDTVLTECDIITQRENSGEEEQGGQSAYHEDHEEDSQDQPS